MSNEPQIAELKQCCTLLLEKTSDKASILRVNELGPFNFEKIEGSIDVIRWISEQVEKISLESITENTINSMISNYKNLLHILNSITTFDPIQESSPANVRDQLATKFQDVTQSINHMVGLWIITALFRRGEIQNWISNIESQQNKVEELFSDASSFIRERSEEIDKTLQAARVAAGEAGAAEFTHEFRNEAGAAEKRSHQWLKAAISLSLLALALSAALIFDWFGSAPSNAWEAIYGIGGRVIAVSVLFYAAIWCGRVVLANMHLASVNRHRAISLQTLQAFHKAADDPAAKDAVVLEAARAVYENVPSGHIARQAGGAGGPGRTIEVIRGANRGLSGSGSGAGQAD